MKVLKLVTTSTYIDRILYYFEEEIFFFFVNRRRNLKLVKRLINVQTPEVKVISLFHRQMKKKKTCKLS